MFSKIYLAYINNNNKKVPHADCLLQAMSLVFLHSSSKDQLL